MAGATKERQAVQVFMNYWQGDYCGETVVYADNVEQLELSFFLARQINLGKMRKQEQSEVFTALVENTYLFWDLVATAKEVAELIKKLQAPDLLAAKIKQFDPSDFERGSMIEVWELVTGKQWQDDVEED